MGFWNGLADGFTGAAAGTWEGLKSLAQGGYALATDPAARERAWEATKSSAQWVHDYADKVVNDPVKLGRDARDGALAAYTAAENFVTTADAEDWGKLAGGGGFEIGTALVPVGALAKAGKLGKLAKVGKGLDKVEDVVDAVEDTADAAKKLDLVTTKGIHKCSKKIPPKSWDKFDARHNDEFMDVLEEFRGTSDLTPTPKHSGREGQLFTSPKEPNMALKRWFEKSPVEMEKSVQALEDVRKAVGNNPRLAKDIDVVRIHERGSDWIKRDYDPGSVPLKKAMEKPAVFEMRNRVMEELGRSRDESLGSLAKKLRRDPPSVNLHWSYTRNKILVFDPQ
ncbi:hypothetical protein [Candidatus Thiosymbion oneisti]|uniref:hypothetical protein n=1 Tax=Candidatus Thiosymbion oneisti TaxID=589554 RepID=UPI000A4C325F|nr:hypothetical protein [Candidatus Thiosymbion oneisti]